MYGSQGPSPQLDWSIPPCMMGEQRVLVEGQSSDWKTVTSGIPLGSFSSYSHPIKNSIMVKCMPYIVNK